MVQLRYGSPEDLRLEEVPLPVPGPGEVRIALRAVSLNGTDAEFLTGKPAYARLYGGLFGAKIGVLGSDVAGVVDVVGRDVTRFASGDAVYADLFGIFGGLAEYVCAPEAELVDKPADVSFEQAAALPQAGVLALQGTRDKVQPGQSVLILGAGGCVGTFAVQLAKHYGGEVTAVDRAEKRAMLRELGADHVLDYATEDFLESGRRYDHILDIVGRRSVFDCERALAPGGTYAIVGGMMKHVLSAVVVGRWFGLTRDKKMGILAWDKNTRDLEAVCELVQQGHIEPAIDRCFPLENAREAFELLTEGRANGKLVITMNGRE
jgi:NADPH:quinone reductase-like Zn-dependent oxidoreductase